MGTGLDRIPAIKQMTAADDCPTVRREDLDELARSAASGSMGVRMDSLRTRRAAAKRAWARVDAPAGNRSHLARHGNSRLVFARG